jgi:hypothetical protein
VLGEFDTFIDFYVVHLPIIKLKTSNDGLMDDGLMDGCVCFLPRNYPLLLLGRIVSYRQTRGALWLPEFRVDQLYFGGRERAPGEFSEMLQAGIEIQP